MDLLFKRYASPFAYLDGLLATHSMLQGIKYLVNQEDEDKLWQLYLHSYQKQSFNDWKKQVLEVESNPHEVSEAEMATIIKQSNDILKSFQA